MEGSHRSSTHRVTYARYGVSREPNKFSGTSRTCMIVVICGVRTTHWQQAGMCTVSVPPHGGPRTRCARESSRLGVDHQVTDVLGELA